MLYMHILPPKTDRKANGKRPDVMPTSRGNEQGLALLKDAFLIHSIPELWKFSQLWCLNIYLQCTYMREVIYKTCTCTFHGFKYI